MDWSIRPLSTNVPHGHETIKGYGHSTKSAAAWEMVKRNLGKVKEVWGRGKHPEEFRHDSTSRREQESKEDQARKTESDTKRIPVHKAITHSATADPAPKATDDQPNSAKIRPRNPTNPD